MKMREDLRRRVARWASASSHWPKSYLTAQDLALYYKMPEKAHEFIPVLDWCAASGDFRKVDEVYDRKRRKVKILHPLEIQYEIDGWYEYNPEQKPAQQGKFCPKCQKAFKGRHAQSSEKRFHDPEKCAETMADRIINS